MRRRFAATLAGILAFASGTTMSLADCESDLNALENAYKTASAKAEVKSALDEAKTKALAALKKDDDNACHKAIAAGLQKAGVELK
jgi:hypothetical protein